MAGTAGPQPGVDIKKYPATPVDKQGEDSIDEADISNKSWASVDKSKLPSGCFLWVEDPDKKSTWHLPYREGSGELKDGMYTAAGPINAGAVRAIQAALGGARSGKAMSVPDEVRKKAENLAKQLKIGKYAEAEEKKSRFKEALYMLEQAFISLGDAIEDAVEDKWGDKYDLYDFSDSEVVLREAPPTSGAAPVDFEDLKYYRVGYKLTDDEVTFNGEPVEAQQVVDYV